MISIAELKLWGPPRVHPNGFIQLDEPGTAGRVRLHIWPVAELPKQGTNHPIHDHVFDMHSEVLRGQMINAMFHFKASPKGNYELHRAVYKTPHDSTLEPTGEIGYVHHVNHNIVNEGESYDLPPFVLHQSIVVVRPTVTKMHKTWIHEPHKPCVAIPRGVKPDNDYSRHGVDEVKLWKIIEESL